MNKKTIIVIAVIVISSILLLTLPKYGVIWRHFEVSVSSKPASSLIEQLIVKSIKIQYKGGDKKELPRIFTPDFIRQIDTNPNFYKKKIFYTVDKNFMESFRSLNDNQAMVTVRVEDLSGSYIQVITLTKDSNGSYLISNIEFDI